MSESSGTQVARVWHADVHDEESGAVIASLDAAAAAVETITLEWDGRGLFRLS